MNLNEILDTTVFGLSLRWVAMFCLKAAVIYLFVRAVTAFIKYLSAARSGARASWPSTRPRPVS